MDIPGAPGAVESPAVWEKAEQEANRLREELKKAVKAEPREIGVLRRELTITVPAQVIADHLDHNYGELMHDALVPGFRKGRAPRRLIEKRFGAEVRESLTTSIIGQSFFAAVENEKLDVLGDPLFRVTAGESVKLVGFDEALEHFKLPEQGDFAYVCEVELKPMLTLPELKGIEVKTPEIVITDEMVDERILRQRKNRGRYEPVLDAPAEKDDQVIADVTLRVAGAEVKREENASIGVRPTRVDGIPLVTLDKTLAGVRPGETRQADCTIPDDYERADLRGQAGQFEFKVYEVKRLVPEPLEEAIKTWGFADEAEARAEFRRDLESERHDLLQRAKRAQIEEYLLNNTPLDLPGDFTARQTERAVVRRAIELQRAGVPVSEIEAKIDELRTSAKEQVASGLKLGFILDKVAEQLKVEVTDEEVNTEIARMARLYNRRFDRVRDDLQNRGLLDQLVEQLRQSKCVAQLLKDARLVTAEAPEQTPEST